jgi:hypothetical protein
MKSRISSFTAATLLAMAVAACAPGNPVTPPASTGGVSTDVAGDAPATAAPTASPTSAPDTPAPTPSAAPSAGQQAIGTGTLRGKVYDENGAAVAEGTVVIRSLNASAPFETTIALIRGSYVANAVPAGVPIEVTASRTGWTSRTQVTNVLPTLPNVVPNEINFGGAANAYFLARYPEVIAVTPANDATNVSADKLVYTLTLSEPLDLANRRRFERAVRIVPANDAANGGIAASTSDLESQEDNGLPLNLLMPYQVQRGSVFMDETARAAEVSWSADGRTATLSFDAPLIASSRDEAKYQVVLISDGTRITDGDGHQLGTNAAGSRTSYPAAGEVIRSVFKPQSLALKAVPGLSGADAAWAATHTNVVTFEVAEDKTVPVLTAVGVTRRSTDTRISLTFSEPMAAFNNTKAGFSSAAIAELANYSFAVAKRTSKLDGIKLDGTVGASDLVDPAVTLTWDADNQLEREFKFDPASFAADGQTATAGQVVAEVDPLDAKRVMLTLVGRPNFFLSEFAGIKARVVGVQDPAGNTITINQADRNVKTGQI